MQPTTIVPQYSTMLSWETNVSGLHQNAKQIVCQEARYLRPYADLSYKPSKIRVLIVDQRQAKYYTDSRDCAGTVDYQLSYIPNSAGGQ